MDKFDIRSAKLIGIFVVVILLTVSYLGYISSVYEKRSEKTKNEIVVQDVKSEENTEEKSVVDANTSSSSSSSSYRLSHIDNISALR